MKHLPFKINLKALGGGLLAIGLVGKEIISGKAAWWISLTLAALGAVLGAVEFKSASSR